MTRRRRPSIRTFSDQYSACGEKWKMREKNRRKEAKALTSKMIILVVFDIFPQISLCFRVFVIVTMKLFCCCRKVNDYPQGSLFPFPVLQLWPSDQNHINLVPLSQAQKFRLCRPFVLFPPPKVLWFPATACVHARAANVRQSPAAHSHSFLV